MNSTRDRDDLEIESADQTNNNISNKNINLLEGMHKNNTGIEMIT